MGSFLYYFFFIIENPVTTDSKDEDYFIVIKTSALIYKKLTMKKIINYNQLHYPSWLSGFVDGEGCFSISFTKRPANTLGIDVKPSFSLSQHIRSESCLYDIQNYFNCGSIRFDKHNQNYKFEIRNLSHIYNYILPHFEKYPLLTNKLNDFYKFHYICYLMKRKLHLNPLGLETIINLAYSMNNSGVRKFSKYELISLISKKNISKSINFPNYSSYINNFNNNILDDSETNLKRTENQNQNQNQKQDNLLDYASWFTGFIDGEGCFFVSILINKQKTALKITMSFQVDQYETSKKCIESIKNYLNCGYIIKRKTKMHSFRVNSIKDIQNIIIPHFSKYSLLTNKNKSFLMFKQLLNITEGKWVNIKDIKIKEIIDLVYDMNPSGKRKYKKEDWLKWI